MFQREYKKISDFSAMEQNPVAPDSISGFETVPTIGVEAWSVSIDHIFADHGLRLDATYFDPEAAMVVANMKSSGLDLYRLGDLATVDLPSQFSRVWAEDAEHGIPYLNATDLMSLFALGVPAATRYLSHASDTNIDHLTVREGWLLLTCSGTIGRVFHVPERLDGWVATHDLIRIKPESEVSGYLLAWCRTQAAQAQIAKPTHGGQIDHVTAEQIAEVLVPMLPEDKVRMINDQVIEALNDQELAIKKMATAWPERNGL